MKPITLDLVICTYNNASLLERTLEAISQQKVSPDVQWQILVVNNNCTDETVQIVEKYSKSGLIPLRMLTETTQGLTPARLCGVKNTNGEWIAFVDDDCLLAQNWVEMATKFALSHSDCGAFGGRVILEWETPPPAFVLNFGYSFAQQEHGDVAKKISCLVGAGMVIRRTALAESGWIDKQLLADRIGKKLISGGDVEIALRLGAKYDLWYNPDCQLKHIIPTKRIAIKYLKAINRSLGRSKLFGDSMLWSGSYESWLLVSVKKGLQDSIYLLIQWVKALKRRKSLTEIAITFNFMCGWWLGLWRMLWMNSQQRKNLLGSAKVSH